MSISIVVVFAELKHLKMGSFMSHTALTMLFIFSLSCGEKCFVPATGTLPLHLHHGTCIRDQSVPDALGFRGQCHTQEVHPLSLGSIWRYLRGYRRNGGARPGVPPRTPPLNGRMRLGSRLRALLPGTPGVRPAQDLCQREREKGKNNLYTRGFNFFFYFFYLTKIRKRNIQQFFFFFFGDRTWNISMTRSCALTA